MKKYLGLLLVVGLLIVTVFWPVLFGFGLVAGLVRSLDSIPPSQVDQPELAYVRGDQNSDNHLVLLPLTGILLDQSSDPFEVFSGVTTVESFSKTLWQLPENKNHKAVIVEIDSPGGTVTAAEALSAELAHFKTQHPEIPVYVYGRGLMASGAYWVATNAKTIWTQPGAIVGSIGVIGPQFPVFDQVTEYNQGLLGPGITSREPLRFFSITAGKGKDFGSAFVSPSDEALSRAQDTVDAAYLRFVTQVATGRNLDTPFLTDSVGAYVYDAEAAKNLRLVDEVGFSWQLEEAISLELVLPDYQVVKVESSVSFLQGLWSKASPASSCKPSSKLLAIWGDPAIVCE